VFRQYFKLWLYEAFKIKKIQARNLNEPILLNSFWYNEKTIRIIWIFAQEILKNEGKWKWALGFN